MPRVSVCCTSSPLVNRISPFQLSITSFSSLLHPAIANAAAAIIINAFVLIFVLFLIVFLFMVL